MTDAGGELYIDVSPGERRAALLDAEEGRLRHLAIDRDGRPAAVETILAARVTSVDGQTGAAFLDLGAIGDGLLAKAGKLTQGAAIAIQVSRDAHGGKGAAVTRSWTLHERYLSWTVGRQGISWARALGQGKRRAELEEILARALDAMGASGLDDGLQVRAPATAVGEGALLADLRRLAARRAAVERALKEAKPPAVLEAPADFALRQARDAPAECRIATDDRAFFQRLKQRVEGDWPDLAAGIAFADPAKGALLERAGIADEIVDALARHVSIPGGGRLTIDDTEAMTVIDVDSARSADGGGLKDEAVFRLNKRACEEAARQIRLRNLSGLIVIDCVTLRAKGRMRALVDAMRAAVKGDPVKTDVLGVTAAGLIEITRQRTGPSLGELHYAPMGDPAPAPDAQAAAILRAVLRNPGPGRPVAVASEAVARALDGPLVAARADCERRLGRSLEIRRGPDSVPPRIDLER